MQPQETYSQRIHKLNTIKQKTLQRRAILGWGRFAIAILVALTWYLFYGSSWNYLLLASAILIALFLRLVVVSARTNEKIRNLQLLLDVNGLELKILEGDYHALPDGHHFLPHDHPYAGDLDLFGRASLYQYLNRTTSEQGNALFAKWLLNPATPADVVSRQKAAAELSPNYIWRQQFMAHGMANTITHQTEDGVLKWHQQPSVLTEKAFQWLRFLLPAIPIAFLVAYLFDFIPGPIFMGVAFIFFLIAGTFSLKITLLHRDLNTVAKELNTLVLSLQSVEALDTKSSLLDSIRKNLVSSHGNASTIIKKLTSILDRLEVRLNPFVHIFLNTFLFWDLQQALQLNHWKKHYAGLVSRWFIALAEMEAISTLAAIHFNHPNWTMPTVINEQGMLKAVELGHPLIAPKKAVRSSFQTTGLARLAIITGSNMAGKSTFLRSIGTNLVLAMMGSPVCAVSLTSSPMRVMSSMRIADNLEESTSTFYAELKKLKQIIDAVNAHQEVFILLDEILRGTNSLDRNTGSRALIRQLIARQAVGILATHDLQLTALTEQFPENLSNYHFDVQIKDDELFFDYKLKEGVCTSMNASILMRKIGIEM